MVRTYTILATNEELQTSPYIHKLQRQYDLVLTARQATIVNFLFQTPISRSEAHKVYAMYDEGALKVDGVHIDCFQNQTLVSTTLTTKDIGSMKISLVVPDHLSMKDTRPAAASQNY